MLYYYSSSWEGLADHIFEEIKANKPNLLITLIENGEWHDARNDKGNIIVFLNDFEAIDYSRSDQFKEKLGKYAILVRVTKIQVLKTKVGNQL